MKTGWILCAVLLIAVQGFAAPAKKRKPAKRADHAASIAKKTKKPDSLKREKQLVALAARIDQEMGASAHSTELLADHFGVPFSSIEDLRAQRKRWGEITLRLAAAKELQRTNPIHFATVSDALDHINRHRPASWRRVARENRLSLESVLAHARQCHARLTSSQQHAELPQ